MYGGHVYVWWTCVCMVDMCTYGGHVYVWWTCVCMVDMCMYGGKSKESHLQDTSCNASVFLTSKYPPQYSGIIIMYTVALQCWTYKLS